MTTFWKTTSITPTNAPAAVMVITPRGEAMALPAAGVLTQDNGLGNTREVLGFTSPRGDVLPRDEFPSSASPVMTVDLRKTQTVFTADEVKRAAAKVYDDLTDSPKTTAELARVMRGTLRPTAALLLMLREGLVKREGELWELTTAPTDDGDLGGVPAELDDEDADAATEDGDSDDEPTPRDAVDRIWRD